MIGLHQLRRRPKVPRLLRRAGQRARQPWRAFTERQTSWSCLSGSPSDQSGRPRFGAEGQEHSAFAVPAPREPPSSIPIIPPEIAVAPQTSHGSRCHKARRYRTAEEGAYARTGRKRRPAKVKYGDCRNCNLRHIGSGTRDLVDRHNELEQPHRAIHRLVCVRRATPSRYRPCTLVARSRCDHTPPAWSVTPSHQGTSS